MIRKIFLWLLLISLILFSYVEKRNFYCFKNGDCVTVWKTLNNNCYIIPGKHYSIFLPNDNYLKTSSSNNLTIFFSTALRKAFVYKSEQVLEIHNKKKEQFTFYDFHADSIKFDSILYSPGSVKNNEVRGNVQLMDIFIDESFALDGTGKKL